MLTEERPLAEQPAESTADAPAGRAGGTGAPTARGGEAHEPDDGRRRPSVDDRGDVLRAYASYLAIIAIFSITNIPAVVDFLAKEPFTYLFDCPGLDITNNAGDPVLTQFKLNWLPAVGTLLVIAGLITMASLKVTPGRALAMCGRTYVELRAAIITVIAVLGLAYVMNLSGQTASLGVWLAGTGGFFAILSPILGWLGVAVTGPETSSNSYVRRPAGAGRRQGRVGPGADSRLELVGRCARSTALPSASAGATERMPRIIGALNGAITETKPTPGSAPGAGRRSTCA